VDIRLFNPARGLLVVTAAAGVKMVGIAGLNDPACEDDWIECVRVEDGDKGGRGDDIDLEALRVDIEDSTTKVGRDGSASLRSSAESSRDMTGAISGG